VSNIRIRLATADDAGLLLQLIRELAAYERAPNAVVATEEDLRRYGFGPERQFEALLAFLDGEPAGLALFHPRSSTWLGRPWVYLEDLFVIQAARGKGVGRRLMAGLPQSRSSAAGSGSIFRCLTGTRLASSTAGSASSILASGYATGVMREVAAQTIVERRDTGIAHGAPKSDRHLLHHGHRSPSARSASAACRPPRAGGCLGRGFLRSRDRLAARPAAEHRPYPDRSDRDVHRRIPHRPHQRQNRPRQLTLKRKFSMAVPRGKWPPHVAPVADRLPERRSRVGQVRSGLSARGRWIRTSGSGASGEADAFQPVKDRPR
jgi:GNAT superfamily N-acetyltransferase